MPTTTPPFLTIELEDLIPPEGPLPTEPASWVMGRLTERMDQYQVNEEELVDLGRHPFLRTLHACWTDHRPFVLSPDMVWLLICQGFNLHLAQHAHELKDQVPLHPAEGKAPVSIRLDQHEPLFGSRFFTRFHQGIREAIQPELADVLTADFSTSGPTERMTHLITMMSGMSVFLEYTVRRAVCGIPAIHLEGNPEDWQAIIDKTRFLRQYQLAWWTDTLIPVLEQIRDSAAGKVEVDFWRRIFKIYQRDLKGKKRSPYSQVDFIDGWVTHLFPYTRSGRRRAGEKISLKNLDGMPNEQCHAPLTMEYVGADGTVVARESLALIAGFVGAAQNPQTLALRPAMGCLSTSEPQTRIPKSDGLSLTYRNLIRFPMELFEEINDETWPEVFVQDHPELAGLSFREGYNLLYEKDQKYYYRYVHALPRRPVIRWLTLHFLGAIDIPDEIAQLDPLRELALRGEIQPEEIQRIRELMPRTEIVVNGEEYESID